MKKPASGIAAVIFDMDGVITDSMPYHFLAWYESLRPLGIRVSCFDVYSKEGERWQKSLLDFLKKGRFKPNPRLLKKIFRQRQRIFRKYFKRTIFEGAEEFIACLKDRGYLIGLVTGTPIQEVETILPKHMRKLFDCVVTGDSLSRGKPNPEPYLKAASLLKVKPSQCLVVENAPLGIESAKRAGMFCVALTTSLPATYLKRADVIADRLEQITNVIEQGCRI